MAMATPIRKKRNFKALQLNVAESASATAKDAEPVAMRQAPPPVAAAQSAPVERKKRPPPMIIKAPKIPTSSGAVSAVEQDGNLLTVVSGPPPPHSASPAIRRNTYHATLSNTLANLDMNAEIKFDLKDGDLKDLQELGQGNGGSVKKVEHVPTKTIMAKKVSRCLLRFFLLEAKTASACRLS
jgi:mitogen-activated protein kinase kinase